MAKNTGNGFRLGPQKDRIQVENPRTHLNVKIDTKTGKFMGDSVNFKDVIHKK